MTLTTTSRTGERIRDVLAQLTPDAETQLCALVLLVEYRRAMRAAAAGSPDLAAADRAVEDLRRLLLGRLRTLVATPGGEGGAS